MSDQQQTWDAMRSWFTKFRGNGPPQGIGGEQAPRQPRPGVPMERREDPLEDWRQRLIDLQVHGVKQYEIGSEPEKERELAVLLGWDGQGSMEEFMTEATLGRVDSTEWRPGNKVMTEVVKTLLDKALVR